MGTNYGVGGQTMFKPEHLPTGDHSSYWTRAQYQQVLTSNATIIVLMLGTNDAKTNRFAEYGSFFASDYEAMVKSFLAMPSKPKVLTMVPPPLYVNDAYGMNQTVINSVFPGNGPAGVRTIATKLGLDTPIDLYSLFQAHCPVSGGTPGHGNNNTDTYCDWIGSGGKDGCHPDDTGYGEIASLVATTIRALTDE